MSWIIVYTKVFQSHEKTGKLNSCLYSQEWGYMKLFIALGINCLDFLVFGVDYVIACIDKNSIKGLWNKNYFKTKNLCEAKNDKHFQ